MSNVVYFFCLSIFLFYKLSVILFKSNLNIMLTLWTKHFYYSDPGSRPPTPGINIAFTNWQCSHIPFILFYHFCGISPMCKTAHEGMLRKTWWTPILVHLITIISCLQCVNNLMKSSSLVPGLIQGALWALCCQWSAVFIQNSLTGSFFCLCRSPRPVVVTS